jgi:tryptophan halogenase
METDRRIRRIAIVGGGLSGWLAAAALARKVGGHCSIHVVEAPDVPVAGHGEATLSSFVELLRFLGIEQNDFVDKTQSTYSLGTKFLDWPASGQSFWRPFGAFGALLERRPFYHFWHKARAAGLSPKIEFFSTETAMAMAQRFIFPTNSLGVAAQLRYGLHIDVAMAARYLRNVAERAGVIRLERKVVSVQRREDGHVEQVGFEDGGSLRADLFIDNTGPRAQLIGEALGVGFESWKHLLPVDRVVLAPTNLEDSRPPYTRIGAHAAGWQWRIPLQQVLSVGHVYSSAHQDDDAALEALKSAAGTPLLADARVAHIDAGRREKFWDHNVVALGHAAGCVEPLAATNLHHAAHVIFNLLDHFPDRQFDPANIASYNAVIADDLERSRDFILLHYCAAPRDDSPFWQHFAALTLPPTVARRIEQYRATGRIASSETALFGDLDWFWVFEGAGILPRDYDPLVDTIDFEQVKRLMVAVSQKVKADVTAAPTHDSFFATANSRLASARKAAAIAPSG